MQYVAIHPLLSSSHRYSLLHKSWNTAWCQRLRLGVAAECYCSWAAVLLQMISLWCFQLEIFLRNQTPCIEKKNVNTVSWLETLQCSEIELQRRLQIRSVAPFYPQSNFDTRRDGVRCRENDVVRWKTATFFLPSLRLRAAIS